MQNCYNKIKLNKLMFFKKVYKLNMSIRFMFVCFVSLLLNIKFQVCFLKSISWYLAKKKKLFRPIYTQFFRGITCTFLLMTSQNPTNTSIFLSTCLPFRISKQLSYNSHLTYFSSNYTLNQPLISFPNEQ